MLPLTIEGSNIILQFRCLFSKKVFEQVKVLFAGALLCIGRRTVCALLRIMGLGSEKRFHKYHRVLSLVKWSLLKAGKTLLLLLVQRFYAASEPLVFDLDETIERRRGERIKAKGIYRDPVRSSKSHFVKCSGLRWMCLMLLCRIPWAQRVWALPFLTILAPSERYCVEQGRQHKKITDWARQMIFQLYRWMKGRTLIVVADSTYAALELLNAVRSYVTFICRLRLDAALYEAPAEKQTGKAGRPRLKGKRLPTLQQVLDDPATQWQTLVIAQWYDEQEVTMLVATATAIWYHSGMTPVAIRWVLLKDPEGKKEPAALLGTDLQMQAACIINYFIRRWTLEITFEETRAHLGVETQRQWSDQAIARSTPCLMGLFSITALWADSLQNKSSIEVQQTAWYHKKLPTFSDALATVRSQIWKERNFCMSHENEDMIKIPKRLLNELTSILCRAA